MQQSGHKFRMLLYNQNWQFMMIFQFEAYLKVGLGYNRFFLMRPWQGHLNKWSNTIRAIQEGESSRHHLTKEEVCTPGTSVSS